MASNCHSHLDAHHVPRVVARQGVKSMDTVAPWMDALHEERRLQVNEQQTSFHNEHRTVDAFADGPGVALLGLIFVLFAVFAAVFALCSYCNVGDRINLMLARRRSSQTAVELPPEVAMTELNDAAEAARAAEAAHLSLIHI